MSVERDEALRRAALDPRLQWVSLRVFAFLLGDLDPDQYRPVKLLSLARQLRVHRGNVSKALQVLIMTGHLELGPVEDRTNTFRLGVAVRKGMLPQGNQKSG